jgi:hypothetical protein
MFREYKQRCDRGEFQIGTLLALATLLEAAGPGAEEQVGRIRARHQQT